MPAADSKLHLAIVLNHLLHMFNLGQACRVSVCMNCCPVSVVPLYSYNKTLLKGFAHPLTVTNIQVGLTSSRREGDAAVLQLHGNAAAWQSGSGGRMQ